MSLLPDTPDFRQILDSLTVSTDPGVCLIRAEIPGRLANGGLVVFPPLFLHSSQEGKIKLAALSRRLIESWQGTEHPTSAKIAEPALAVFSLLRTGYPDSLSLFNRLLESTVPVDVSHFAVFPGTAQEGKPAEFAGFRMGAVQSLSLQHRSTRARSDYFDLHGKLLQHRCCIESPIYKRAVMGFLDLFWQAPSRQTIPNELFFQVLLSYYEALTFSYAERMWQDLDDKQSIGGAAGLEAFDVPSLKRMPGTIFVSVYLNQTRHRWDGYVVPLALSMFHMNSWVGNPPILKTLNAYQADLTFPRSPTLSQVARFGVRARRAANRSDWAEALLNFTIALEMLFSERNQTGQAVSRRFAVVASEPVPEAFAAHRKEILSLYDARSQYVHAGVTPSQTAVESMTGLFEKALAVLVRLERKHVLHEDESFARWIRLLDWIASGYEAGQVPATAVLEEAGLCVVGGGGVSTVTP
ncbi:MAG: HEPN domain-containing protein [Verrucomicrobia bacterium]|nr:HEPN domain-containing protein [Verrucomicrobiota bacterium]